MKQNRYIIKTYIWIAFIAAVFCLFAGAIFFAATENTGYLSEPSSFNSGIVLQSWSYRWEDASVSIESLENSADLWKPTSSTIDIYGRDENKILYLRAFIPSISVSDPAIFCKLVFEVFDVYLSGEKIYFFGDPLAAGPEAFRGWPWHIITLPEKSAGQEIIFRISSQHPKIGILGDVIVNTRVEHLISILRDKTDMFILSFIFIFMGLFLILLFFRDRENEVKLGYFSLGGSAFLMGLFTLSRAGSDLKQIYFDSPLLWSYVELLSLYFIPVGLITFIERIRPYKILSILWKIHLFAGSMSFFLILIRQVHPSHTINLNVMLILITTTVVVISMLITALKGSTEAKIFTASLFFLGIVIFFDILAAINFIKTEKSYSHWGILFMFIALSAMLGFRYRKMNRDIDLTMRKLESSNKELITYKNHLEQLVQDRTEELSSLNKELEILSQTDPLTSLMNRRYFSIRYEEECKRMIRLKKPLSLLMIDIDFFKDYNDTYGHQAGDKALQQVSSVIKKVLCRSMDISARYGGEEFISVLPDTDISGALFIAEQLRVSVYNLNIPVGAYSHWGRITVSIGVAVCLPHESGQSDEYITQSDCALYKAKSSGRNRVETYS